MHRRHDVPEFLSSTHNTMPRRNRPGLKVEEEPIARR